MHDAQRGQEKLSDSLEMELQNMVSCHMSAGTEFTSSAETVSALNTEPSL